MSAGRRPTVLRDLLCALFRAIAELGDPYRGLPPGTTREDLKALEALREALDAAPTADDPQEGTTP